MNQIQWKSWHREQRLIKTEKWKCIPGYEGFYEVSNLGRVKSLSRKLGFVLSKDKILKPRKDKGGYLTVSLSNSFGVKNIKIHRLVLLSFIGESDSMVNHKDGIRDNNIIYNLEYCTRSYNAVHAYQILGSKKGGSGRKGILNGMSKKIGKYSLKGDLLEIYESIKIASESIGKNHSHISQVCNGKRNTAYGFIWKLI